ncbi:fasciclin domain-containing protein [Saccharicrinis sp. FJH2]|uniref:fasciclin domain-containing protein n=1 Tax=Saccharicrinis sp. FJH65 TaxID=3344659 RepID=UPI0035F26AC1
MQKILTTFLLGFVLFACKDPYEGTTYVAYDELPVASYLNSRSEDFSLWVELLRYTGLYSTFNLYTDYTAFVPNNAAMEKFMNEQGYNSVTDIDKEYATFLVKYHTLHNKVLKQEEFSSGVMNWPTAIDEYLSISFGEGGLNAIYINNTSKIVELNIEVTNGVVHVLDEVLIPVVETIWDRIDSDRFSIMKDAVTATGYNALLNKVQDTALDLSGNEIIKRYYFTLFAVPDSIYSIDGVQSLDDLKTKIGVDQTDYTNPDNLLNQYVAYHIVSQRQSYDVLATFQDGVESKNINTLANKELINISKSDNGIWINYDETVQTGTRFIPFRNDITCKNGVLHEVDTWMPVATPPTTVIDWDLSNYADLAAICDYFQSPNGRGGSGTYEKVVPEDEVAAYYWEAIPLTKPDVIKYVNNRNNDGAYYDCKFYDHLEISTGAGGWVEIKTPVIVKGTYKMTLFYVSYLSVNSAGEMQCYMDNDTKLGSSFFVSNATSTRYSEKVLVNSITFDETDEHTLRIVGIDGKKLELDYIKFEPIN